MKTLTPIKAIREKCMDCSVFQPKEIRTCHIIDCALFLFRMGKNPNRKGIGKKKVVSEKKLLE